MTSDAGTPPLAPEELVSTAGEREAMEAFLEYYRGLLPAKVRGLSEQDARRRLVPSATTLAGLLKHLAAVERGWFQRRLGGVDEAAIEGNARGDGPSWIVTETQAIDDLAAELEEACARSRAVAAGLRLEDSVPGVVALGVPAHDRGVRPARGARRHPARADGRRGRRLSGSRQRALPATRRPAAAQRAALDLAS
jgi:hypothetical protein